MKHSLKEIFVAEDGTEFSDLSSCERHEARVQLECELMGLIDNHIVYGRELPSPEDLVSALADWFERKVSSKTLPP